MTESTTECRWRRPDLPSRCTYKLGMSLENSPHRHVAPRPHPKIMPNILHNIGNTPLVRVNRIGASAGLECELLAKCDFFNAGGSIKDRIGYRMVEDAELRGQLKPGDVLIEPTSGNTGIGIALAAAVKGYRCIIVLPEKMSKEKVDVLRALGAEIIRTPTAAAFDSPESNIGVARRLLDEIPNSHVLDQYRNASNPLAHYDGTAEEIIEACEGKLDMVVCSAGTGGTIAGIARKIKEKHPQCIVIGVDPYGSILAEPPEINKSETTFYEVEGIGYDFVPTVCEREHVDKWYKSSDKESLIMARRLISEEGFLCGGSCGAAMYCAVQAAKDYGLKAGQRVVVIMPDSVRNYMTKFLSDDWMFERQLLDVDKEDLCPNAWWKKLKVTSMDLIQTSIGPNRTIDESLQLMSSEHLDQVPVVDNKGDVLGVAFVSQLMSLLARGQVSLTDLILKGMTKTFKEVAADVTLEKVWRTLVNEPYAVVVNKSKELSADGQTSVIKKTLVGSVTRLHLTNFISKDAGQHATVALVNGSSYGSAPLNGNCNGH